MIYYSDLYLGDQHDNKFSRRFHDFGFAQQVCQELEDQGKPFYLLLWGENRKIITLLKRFRVPKLQTTPH